MQAAVLFTVAAAGLQWENYKQNIKLQFMGLSKKKTDILRKREKTREKVRK